MSTETVTFFIQKHRNVQVTACLLLQSIKDTKKPPEPKDALCKKLLKFLNPQ